ncbi:hypothetical protein [Knoellia sp. p5-6-4]|uniref:hypothetical protein n=1 Tax=unclassified Knoellia TaxID=2618719 RepID=UPI0023DBD50B|nr:hypothetical protein [Knoellia sp. p5-6-4]MDF2146759.1 hypothetical protein [Knoellia sp. p5-6-4]
MSTSVTATQQSLTYVQALPVLLTVEGFLLAVISLAVTLGTPGRRRPAGTPIPPSAIAWCAAGLAIVVAVGALSAWLGMYTGDTWLPFPQLVIAASLLLAVVAQPVIAVLMAMGLRSGD